MPSNDPHGTETNSRQSILICYDDRGNASNVPYLEGIYSVTVGSNPPLRESVGPIPSPKLFQGTIGLAQHPDRERELGAWIRLGIATVRLNIPTTREKHERELYNQSKTVENVQL